MEKYDVIIIGAGFGGLACGITLSREGFKVLVVEQARSLNLSNTVAIVSYEAMRQLGFPGMAKSGIGIKNL